MSLRFLLGGIKNSRNFHKETKKAAIIHFSMYKIATWLTYSNKSHGFASPLHNGFAKTHKIADSTVSSVSSICRLTHFEFVVNPFSDLFKLIFYFCPLSLKQCYYLGIPFLITNYFCGNKSVFAVLNSLIVRLVQFRSFALQKPFRQAAISFPQKRFAPKRAYFQMIF